MKTAGKITATLALLLGLYVLSYWLLIVEGRISTLKWDSDLLINHPGAYEAVQKAFAPIEEFHEIWTMDLPTRKHLTGHWRSETNGDFVTLGPNQECHFQLGEFSFAGSAKYERDENGFIMEFPHKGQTRLFVLGLNCFLFDLPSSKQASASIGATQFDSSGRGIDYQAILTKHPPSAPAP
jgi:hypothetical protein